MELGQATAELSERKLQQGGWFSETAEHWFFTLLLQYLKTHCTSEATERRLLEIRARQERERLPWVSLKDLRLQLRLANARALDKYFAIFFQTEAIPEGPARFAELSNSLEGRIRVLAAEGRYLI